MPVLAVVLKGYPRLSETFIAQELEQLESRGHDFEIWSLRQPYDDREHAIHGRIKARRRYLPEYLYHEPGRVFRALVVCWRRSGFLRALGAWGRDFLRNPTPGRGRRFGQALVLAAELPPETRFLYVHFLHTPASVTRYAGLIRGLPWGVSAHAKDIWTLPAWEKRRKLAEARFAVTCTERGAEHLSGLTDRPARVTLAYHGLDLSRFPEPPERDGHNGPFTLLSVGRAVAKKGYDDLLDAVALLPDELDWRFVHIGGGALSQTLKTKAGELGLSQRIDWRGKQDQSEVIEAMRAADLFVLPSKIARDGDRDGLPNVLMEAASQHLPILTTRVSAIPEFIEDGTHGRLVEPGDSRALADAIVALAADPCRRQSMAKAARDRLVEHFGTTGIDRIDRRLRAALAAPPRHVLMNIAPDNIGGG